jgi:hypothetical protein
VSDPTLRPGSVATAAAVIGGALIALLPQHAMSIVRLVVLTAAAAAGLYALGVNAPATWWKSPFDRRPRRSRGPDEFESIHSGLSGWRQRLTEGPPLPPDVIRMLRPLVVAAVEQAGAARSGPNATLRVRVAPVTRGILGSGRAVRPRWFRMAPPDKRAVAVAVDTVLDDIERIRGGNGDAAGARAVRPGESDSGARGLTAIRLTSQITQP